MTKTIICRSEDIGNEITKSIRINKYYYASVVDTAVRHKDNHVINIFYVKKPPFQRFLIWLNE